MNSTRKWIHAAWDVAFARYLIVGVANTAFAYAVYAAALYLGASYPVASMISLVAGIILSFKTQGKFVFRNNDKGLFGRFVFSWIIAYLINIGLIGLFLEIGVDEFVGGALALPFNVATGYIFQRYFVFGKSRIE
ncbi:GtrA family protein [Massilia yuzhufengensis]|uniref:Putative flippase GtrA (Transmembrane translocase of bactoprenol-linked glucose) n=1 Tax=Massilia yuzhufengensis TaxID=1164594 RepID=A0A1I1DHE8_9BURK|nr:GtrA family protein [Massilia yuzhufengensis]SFB74389.1 Putative flippase GtrA (transmembrane translocase of bactoprenol-linked glucose) [Massilia yuzhufengensis]